MDFDFESYRARQVARINAELGQRLPPATESPGCLNSAMRYAVLPGGKRLRALVCLAAAEALGGTDAQVMVPALSLEILHAYTLVHDDLPAMDNDTLRRGKPTVHVAFGEATAILAGDALLTLAFEWLAEASAPPPYPPAQPILELARAAGCRGVLAGQAEDLAAENAPPDAPRIEFIHRHKTAALFRAAARLGGIMAGAGATALKTLTCYGEDLGLAFQILDDVLNETSTPAELGKDIGTDRAHGKMTYVSVHGLEAARNEARSLLEQARTSALALPGQAEALAAIAGKLSP